MNDFGLVSICYQNYRWWFHTVNDTLFNSERISVTQARSWENLNPALVDRPVEFSISDRWQQLFLLCFWGASLVGRQQARGRGERKTTFKKKKRKKNLCHCGNSLSGLIPVLMTVCESIKETGQYWVAEQRMRPHNSALRCKAFTTATFTIPLFTNVLINVNQVAKHLFKLHISFSIFLSNVPQNRSTI